MVVTVMPHGVLFRGGAERDIRRGLIEEDLLDAVIGLPPNLFYGTGIPACILVLRAPGAKPPARRGKVLFINADAELRAGRAQNYLDPEHAEKIVRAFEGFHDIDGFATVVTKGALASEDNDYNLNIRRYADNAPAPEPHDVRAHLSGGVPKAEILARAPLFERHGLDVRALLVDRATGPYADFAPALASRADLRAHIEHDPGVAAQEASLRAAFDGWWANHQGRVVALPKEQNLMVVRADLMRSFADALVPVGLLDSFRVTGAVAAWWGASVFDLKALAARDFLGLVEGWVTSILTALEDETSKDDPLDHKLVKRLMPKYLDEIAAVEAEVADVDAKIKAAEATPDDDDGERDEDAALSEDELRAAKAERAAGKKKLRKLKDAFAQRLEKERASLDAAQARALVLDLLVADLRREVDQRVSAHRDQVVEAVERWWDKYRVTLRSLEQDRDATKVRLDGFLKELGYGA
jgi:type I restriction enzyme M protein